MYRKMIQSLFVTLVFLGLHGCAAVEESISHEQKKSEIHVALSPQPPTLDVHITPTGTTRDVTRHIFETLVAVNSDYEVVPDLAEDIKIEDDGTSYTFHLREGIHFHNGKELTAEDVTASLNRWKETTGRAKAIIGDAKFEVVDDYTVILELDEPNFSILDVLANPLQFSAIMPVEVIESAGSDGVDEFIGTGPYQFEEWAQDQHIHLVKNEEYQPVDLEPDGLSGRKKALVDEIYFEIATDSSTRANGLQSGEYDVATSLPFDQYEQIESNPQLVTKLASHQDQNLVFNKENGPASDIKLRQAIAAALDMEEILHGTYTGEQFYNLNSSYMLPNNKWHSEAGSEFYNENDLEKAQQLLEESDYKGEELVMITTRDFQDYHDSSVIIQQQLEKIGIAVDLQVMDWGSLTGVREDREYWDLYSGGFAIPTTPAQLLYLNKDTYGWPDDERLQELIQQTNEASTDKEIQAATDELQAYHWEYLSVVKIGNNYEFTAHGDHVEGYENFEGIKLWNVDSGN